MKGKQKENVADQLRKFLHTQGKYADMLRERLSVLQHDWKQPWFSSSSVLMIDGKVIGKSREECIRILDDMIEHNGWICPIKPEYGDDSYYSISKDEIVLPEKEQYVTEERFFTELFHEMAHSTGAESRLNRLAPTSFGSKEYAMEELTAELTAAVVSWYYGMAKYLKGDSAAYLKTWIYMLEGSGNAVGVILADVEKSVLMIINKIEDYDSN